MVADGLPLDSDLEVAQTRRGRPIPIHVRWRYLALVAAGGAVGTAAREGLSMAIPLVAGFPVATFGINVVGALLLGVLLEALVRRGPDEGRRRSLRLLIGTGFFGGFTTYSTLATDTSLFTAHDDLGAALAYALGTLVLGAVASWAGMAIATRRHGRHQPRTDRVQGARQ